MPQMETFFLIKECILYSDGSNSCYDFKFMAQEKRIRFQYRVKPLMILTRTYKSMMPFKETANLNFSAHSDIGYADQPGDRTRQCQLRNATYPHDH